MVTNREANEQAQPGCWAVLVDRKYFEVGNSCMKRTLRRHEWQTTKEGILVVPAQNFPQRWRNDEAAVRYLRERTNIPLPKFQCVFEDDGAFYHMTEHVDGVSMTELRNEEKKTVMKEIEEHVATLRSLRSDRPGVPGLELMCAPQRTARRRWMDDYCWKPNESVQGDYVFCHNDLGQHNIIVDPKTLKINAIIDWEFAGFCPEWFERPFWRRKGPCSSIKGEEDEDDVAECQEWFEENCEAVVIPAL